MKSQFSSVACVLLLAIPVIAADRTAAARSVWPAETLSGTITIVDPAIKTVVIQTAGGVPFDMVVTRDTRIESGDRAIKLQDLQQDMNKGVSVRFVPERRGDVARVIRLNG
jgi:hypothetical protein